jgi:hypothetical protein
MLRKLKSNKGEGYVDMAIMCIVTIFILSFIINAVPIFFTKLTLDKYAHELVREAELAGRVGEETNTRLARLNEVNDLNPAVSWSRTGNIQLGTEFTVTVSAVVDFSFFTFQGWEVTLVSTSTGVSEVFRK